MTTDAAASGLPDDLRRLTVEIDEILRQTDALLDPLDDEQFNWHPAPGSWSVGQCFEHLNVVNGIYFRGIHRAVERARQAGHRRRGAMTSSALGRLFVWSQEPPFRVKVRAPSRVRPAARRRKAEVWPEFVRFHTHLKGFLQECADVDLNRARFPNPFLPLMKVRAGTGLRILMAHDRRHVWQALRVRQSQGFPRH